MQNNRSASLIKSSLSITAVLLVCKTLSFVRDMLLANYLGASELSDVFLASSGVLFLFTSFILSPFSVAYLPIATEHYLRDPEQGRSSFLGKIYGAAFSLGMIFLLVMLLFLRPLVELMVPGFSPEAKEQLANMLLFQLPAVLFVMLSGVVGGNLRLLGRLNLAESSNGVIALVYVLYLLLFRHHITAAGLGLSTVAAYGASLLLCAAAAARGGIPLRLRRFSRKDPEIRAIFLAMLPSMLAGCVKQVNALVDRVVASLLDSGSVTIQSYASKMTVTEVGLISTAVSMVIFAQASRLSAEHDPGGLDELVSSGLKFVSFLVIPCCVGTILYRYEIISVLFGRGAFTQENVRLTANTMMIYAAGMLGAGIEDVLSRTMHATKHRKFPAMLGAVSMLLNAVLNLLLYRPFGVYGLAAASSAVLLLKIPFYAAYTHRRIIPFTDGRGIVKNILLTTALAFAACFLSLPVKSLVLSHTGSTFAGLLSGAAVAAVLYLSAALLTQKDLRAKLLRR